MKRRSTTTSIKSTKSLRIFSPSQDEESRVGSGVFGRDVSYCLVTYGFFAALFIASAIVAFWQIYGLAQNFFSKPHYIDIELFQYEAKPVFPNVTVCNYNRANANKVQALGITQAAMEHLFLSTAAATYQNYSVHNPTVLEKGSNDWAIFIANSSIDAKLKDPANLLKHLAHSCEDTFLMCRFGDEPFNCCATAVQVLNAEYGSCWVLNAPIFTPNTSAPVQPWSGLSAGLNVAIDPGLAEYLRNLTTNNFLEEGVLISPSFNPHERSFLNLVAASPGTHVRIAMAKFVKQFNEPSFYAFERKCRHGQLKVLKGSYDSGPCQDDCIEIEIIDHCQCYRVQQMNVADELHACDGDQISSCVLPAVNSWLNPELNRRLRQCTEQCKPTCANTIDLHIRGDTNRYPNLRAINIADVREALNLGSHTDAQIMPIIPTVISFDVYFPDKYFTVIFETEKMSLSLLIANIGGQCGFWLGMSFVSLMHVLEMAFEKYIKQRRKHVDADAKLSLVALNWFM